MDAVWIAVLLGIVGVAWYIYHGKDKPQQSTRAQAGPTRARVAGGAPGERFTWPGEGNFDFEVVGESHYQATLRRLAGDHGTENAAVDCVAALTPENDNAHDKSAVQVAVDGEVVGYLSRDDARSFRRRLGRKGLTGQTTLCDAKVVGGRTKRGGEQHAYGIRLDLKPFEN